MNIRQLTMSDYDDTLDLFVECFKNDHYYVDTYGPGVESHIRSAFPPSIRYCIDSGASIGGFLDGWLASFILGFKYQDMKNGNPWVFHQTFDTSHEIIKRIGGGNPYYLMSIAVDHNHRRYGIASTLIDRIMMDHTHIVVDVSNALSLPMYEKRGFQISELSHGYFYVEYKKNI